ncbi:MAG: hypothetical protein WC531_00275 [Candidatus Paceibacterota bacterium]|jgi:hypothetical protein
MKKYLIVLIVVVLVIISAGVVYWKLIKPISIVPDQVACTEEAKICPDGSAVGRQGPNCEFAECPVAQAVDETADWKIYKNDKYGFEFKYPSNWSLSSQGSDQEINIRHYSDSSQKKFDGAIILTVGMPIAGGERPDLVKSEEVKVDGQIATRKIESWSAQSNNNLSYQLNIESGSKILISVYAYDGEHGYSLDTYNSLLDKVMGTFKFTQ